MKKIRYTVFIILGIFWDLIMAKATFAAGCFWGVEATFRQLKGVKNVTAGYTGGHFPHPSYREVCTGTTGHAEAVEFDYDPKVVSYERLLDIFWQCHNPTQYNRQGPDVGSQYRSAIFYHNPEQEHAAKESKARWQSHFHAPIVTEITAASTFYPAEEYHQRYAEKHPNVYCHVLHIKNETTDE